MRIAINIAGVLAVALIGAAAGHYLGSARESSKVAALGTALARHLEAEIGRTSLVLALIRRRPIILSAAEGGALDADGREFLDRVVLASGLDRAMLADTNGRVIGGAQRRLEGAPLPQALAPAIAEAVHVEQLTRRVTPSAGGMAYEVGAAMRGADGQIIGSIFISKPFEDFSVDWRALPDDLTVSKDGLVAFTSSHRTDDFGIGHLTFVQESRVTGLTLTLRRSMAAVIPYALAGGVMGLFLALTLVLTSRVLRLRQALAREKIDNLSRMASRLEEQVRARTLSLTQEVDERKRVERELKEKQSLLIQSAKFKTLGSMAASISHELSQPLFALQAGLETLGRQIEIGSPQAAATAKRVRTLTGRLDHVISNVRSFSRHESDEIVKVNPQNVVSAAIELVGLRFKQAGVSLRHDQPSDTPCVMAGQGRLQQVLINVLSNALEAAHDAVDPLVIVDYPDSIDQVAIRIRDNGDGAKHPERVFDAFYTTKSKSHGLGIGMYISREILAKFPGDISFENIIKDTGDIAGAEVLISLPRHVEERTL